MSLEVKGTITKVLDKVTGTKKDGTGDWVKQSFLIDTKEQYNNILCFEVFGDEKVENLNKYNKVGDEVTVAFNVNTNEWQGKYFTSLSAWTIKKVDATEQHDMNQKTKGAFAGDNSSEDLPF